MKKTDPLDFYDRAGAIVHLVRAVATASRDNRHFVANDSWAVHDACMGIATLAESLEQDLYAYFARPPSSGRAPRSKAPKVSIAGMSVANGDAQEDAAPH